MSDLVELIQEADYAVMEIERSRATIEASKRAFEQAKEDYEQARVLYEQVIAKADGLGISRAKLKKIVEERAAVLAASGILSVPVNQRAAPTAAKAAKKSKAARKSKGETSEAQLAGDEEGRRLDA